MFFWFTEEYYLMGYLVVGVMISLATTAVVGTFNALQKQELTGDVLSHSLLPGMALAFIFIGEKRPLPLTLGCLVSGMVAFFLLDYLPIYTKLKKDSVAGLVLAVFFGLGLVLMTYIQRHSGVEQVGLEHYLLGHISSLTDKDVGAFVGLALLLLLVLCFLYRAWYLICFDLAFAQAIGWPVHRLMLVFRTLSLLAIILGTQMVGVVLLPAVLITSPAAASFWSNRLRPRLVLAALFAMFSGVLGLWLSYHLSHVPPGPAIVLVLNGFGFVSFLFAPKRGWIARRWLRFQYSRKIAEENILKALYELSNQDNTMSGRAFTIEEIMTKRKMKTSSLASTLKRLSAKKMVKRTSKGWLATSQGHQCGRTILNRHLLWEGYLEQYLKLKPADVHNDAEAVEHLITPELETLLRSSTKHSS